MRTRAIDLLLEREWGNDGCCGSCGEPRHHTKTCPWARYLRKVGGLRETKRQNQQRVDYAARMVRPAPSGSRYLDMDAANSLLREVFSDAAVEELSKDPRGLLFLSAR